MFQRSFEIFKKRNEREARMIKIFKKNKPEEKNKKNIGNILGKERETEKNARENKIAKRTAFEKHKISDERKGSENPKQRIRIDDFGYSYQNGGSCDKNITEKSTFASYEAFQKKIKKWKKECDDDNKRQTISKIKTLYIVFEIVNFSLKMQSFIFFGAFEPQSRAARERNGNARFIAYVRAFPVAFSDILPVSGDASVQPERFIYGRILGEMVESEIKKEDGRQSYQRKDGETLFVEPFFARKRICGKLFCGALFFNICCTDKYASKYGVASDGYVEYIVKII